MLAIAPGIMAVGTVRYGGPTNVEVEVAASLPSINLSQWDQVLRCSIILPSGRLQLAVPETSLATSHEIVVAPGTYQALVLWHNLDSITDTTSLSGNDHYKIILWPGEKTKLTVLKKWRAQK